MKFKLKRCTLWLLGILALLVIAERTLLYHGSKLDRIIVRMTGSDLKDPMGKYTAVIDMVNAEIYLHKTGVNIYTLQSARVDVLQEERAILPRYVEWQFLEECTRRDCEMIQINSEGMPYKELIIETIIHTCNSLIYKSKPYNYETETSRHPVNAFYPFSAAKGLVRCNTNTVRFVSDNQLIFTVEGW